MADPLKQDAANAADGGLRIGSKAFSPEDRAAMHTLLAEAVIFRDRSLEHYTLVKRSETKLKHFLRERAGLNLIVHQEFIKLEKPAPFPEPWMGIEAFKHPRDYVLLCCVLGYLEQKGTDEQFLLGEMAQTLVNIYPSEEGYDVSHPMARLTWESIDHRRSMVRVLHFCLEGHLLKEIDGKTHDFALGLDRNVLYESCRYNRYFLMTYPKDITHLHSLEEAAVAMVSGPAVDESDERRFRIYRRLLFGPAYYLHEAPKEDILYLKNQRTRLEAEFQEKTDFTFELTEDMACLTLNSRPQGQAIYPELKALSDIILLLCASLRQKLDELGSPEWGILYLTKPEWVQMLIELRETHKKHLGKTMGDLSPLNFVQQVEAELLRLGAVIVEEELNRIGLKPILARCVGHFSESQRKRSDSANPIKSRSMANEPSWLF